MTSRSADFYYQQILQGRANPPSRRFDEYYRCYPVAMKPGPEREDANHGGKIFMPASALDKLTRLHISYPMLFELINGAMSKQSHAGVLEFTAEEGKVYLPYWLMEVLLLQPGDLIQVKSTDLPPGELIKIQPQSPDFLEISDPKAVLEQAFRGFSCLSKDDIFTFHYNETVYRVAVLEVKPSEKNAISVIETDLEVDFAPPLGYVEPVRAPSGSSTPGGTAAGRAGSLAGQGGTVHSRGSMAQAINYDAIAPSSTQAAAGAKATSSNFLTQGQRLKGGKAATPKPSTPVAGASVNTAAGGVNVVRRYANGPQPLRLPEGKLFFGYEVKAVKKKGEGQEDDNKDKAFHGEGQSLRKKKGDT